MQSSKPVGARVARKAGELDPRFGQDFDIVAYLKQRATLIDGELERRSVAAESTQERLAEAMRYSLLAGGKRLRPILALAACEAVGGSAETAIEYACALEMIHTYSMIHDDLPCMDDDDLRRGKPTNHRVYGEGLAVLAGDGLLTDAFGLVARACNGTVSAEVVLEVIAEMAEAAGSMGMVGGQALDILSEGQPVELPMLEYLHAKKTGALFTAAVRGGARLGGAKAAQLRALSTYARSLGLAFQVIDDILDVEASTEQMGKRTGKDGARGKVTYPSLIGLEQSRALSRRLERDAIAALEAFDRRALPLRHLASFVVERSQ